MARGFAGLILLLVACAKPAPVEAPRDAGPQRTFGGSRPVTLSVPRAYAGRATPLLIALHGYGNSSGPFEKYLGLQSLVDAKGVLLASPDGTRDAKGNRFWNAGSDACCNFNASAVDDVAYLRELIADIRRLYNVDRRRIFVVGHSNGGFMAFRLACELSDELAAVVSLAGATPDCQPKSPVSVLQIHGDRDVGVRFDGGSNILGNGGGDYPGALETTRRWARAAGCQESQSQSGAPIDLEAEVLGAETLVSTHEGCPAGIDVSLWTIQAGSHIPEVTAAFPELVWGWLAAHPRPAKEN
jgi:polyhydroxybutyrate depolymerase